MVDSRDSQVIGFFMQQKEGENSQCIEIIEVIGKVSAERCYRVKKGDTSLLRFSMAFRKLV